VRVPLAGHHHDRAMTRSRCTLLLVSSVVDDLEALIRADLLDRLPPETAGELVGMGTADLVIVYLNWRGRFVAPVPRRVHWAPELVASTGYSTHRDVVNELAARLAAGDDVAPHLSRDVAVAHTSQPDGSRPRRRRDLDGLVAEWGIHHLHLSLDLEPDGFVSRTDDLLFVALQPADAYLIGVFPHGGAWTRRALAETCVRNWPEAGLFHEVRGVVGLAGGSDEADRPALRAAGVTTLLEIDGRVWVPQGQSTAGTPLAAARHAGVLMHVLRELRDRVAVDSQELTTRIRARGGDPAGRAPTWEAAAEDGWHGLRESDTGVFVPWVRVQG